MQPEFNVDPMERIQLEQIARVAELHLTNLTGLSLGGAPLAIEPVNRTQWTATTLDHYRPLFERLTESLGTIMRQQLDQISPEELEEMGGELGPLGPGADPSAFLVGDVATPRPDDAVDDGRARPWATSAAAPSARSTSRSPAPTTA